MYSIKGVFYMNINEIETFDNISDDASAAPIIKRIALQILTLEEGKEVPLRYIRNVVQEVTNRNFSPGSFSGAMRDLIDESDGKVTNPERGFYRYERSIKKTQINELIEGLINDLDNVAIDNILKISDEDLEIIRRIPDIKRELENLKI